MNFFQFAWLIPLLPLAAFAFVTVLSPFYRDKNISSTVAIGAMVLATALAWGVAWQGASSGFGGAEGGRAAETSAAGESHFAGFGGAYTQSFDWAATGNSVFRMGYRIDAPVAAMLAMVTLASLCIHLFSSGYMAEDQRYSRFFSFIALFTASMLGMVLADNLLLFFICWELIGLCYLYREAGSLTLGTAQGEVFNPAFLQRIGSTTNSLGMLVATAIALLIFLGTVGKSAQFPLHVWLPDAMEGPTPVSALIHAATMVAAGVFLVARTYPIFAASPQALFVVAAIGGFTAIFAATMGLGGDGLQRGMASSA